MKSFYEHLVWVESKEKDMPTEVDKKGTKYWLNDDGQLHRVDGPAIIRADGTKEWYLNDKSHREDGPAIEHSHGNKEWCFNGLLHRIDGPAVERKDGYKAWYVNGLLHREDGPAVIKKNGEKKWYLNAKRMKKREYYSVIRESIIDKIGKSIAKMFGFNKDDEWENLEVVDLANYLDKQGMVDASNQIRRLDDYYNG